MPDPLNEWHAYGDAPSLLMISWLCNHYIVHRTVSWLHALSLYGGVKCLQYIPPKENKNKTKNKTKQNKTKQNKTNKKKLLNSSTLHCWIKCSSTSTLYLHNSAKLIIQLHGIAKHFGGEFNFMVWQIMIALPNWIATIFYDVIAICGGWGLAMVTPLPADGFEIMMLYKYFAKENAE